MNMTDNFVIRTFSTMPTSQRQFLLISYLKLCNRIYATVTVQFVIRY